LQKVPKLNVELWQLLSSMQRKADVNWSMVQRNITAAVAGVISFTQDVITAGEFNTQSVMQKSIDIIGLLGYASSEISLKRKLFVRSVLKDDYKDLVSTAITEPSALLFGDNLNQNIRDMNLRNKLRGGFKQKFKMRPDKRFTYQSQSYTKNRNVTFLGKGRRGMSSSTTTQANNYKPNKT